MKIGVVGVGTVGSAVADNLEQVGNQISRQDPAKGYDDSLVGCELIFVCIYDKGSMKELDKVVGSLADLDAAIIIKTTSLPGTTERLAQKYGIGRMAYNPEFLDEDTSDKDFKYQDVVVIGTWDMATCGLLVKALSPFGKRFMIMNPTEAEVAKLAVNSFYALKVSYANQIFDLCEKYNANYEPVKTVMESSRYIHPNHLDVFHKGYRGFGEGKCLPKDSRMLCKSGDVSLVKEAVTVDRKLQWH